jgi:hypothetical protein
MAKWQLEPKPKAVLTAVDPTPVAGPDGRTTQRFRTSFGQVHVQVIFPDHHIEWYLQTEA